jgi:hypothetical protein
MGDIKLNSPRLRVIREGFDPLELQTANPDLVRWDRTRVKHRWPKLDEAPFLWLTFIAWSAARRTGAIAETMSYETWEGDVLDVANLDETDDDELDDELGSPTLPGRDPG